jgi:two-component system sensor histidine kinase DegS
MVSPHKEVHSNAGSSWDVLLETARTELDTVNREIREIDRMIEQSQGEIGKLTQRNATSTMQVQQLQAQFENVPRSDIRSAYESALDAQQRLFMMRSQLDKLQSEKTVLARLQSVLDKVYKAMESVPASGGSRKGLSEAAQTVEMMIQAQESERQKLARQMHDGPAQALTNLILQTDIAMRLFDRDQVKAKEELDNLKTAANSTFQKVRAFIFDLRPMMLDDLGLGPTLNRYVGSFKDQTGLDVRVTSSGMEQRLPPYLEVMIFRAAQELLSNVVRHADASLVKLQLDAASGEVRVSIDDNGKGFDLKTLENSTGMGLKVIRDRVEMLGGEIDIDSVPGQGTRVVFSVPAKTG